MRSHFGQILNVSVATHFIHFSTTATSNLTSEKVTVPERIGPKRETAGRNEKRARKKPSSVLKVISNQTQCDCMFI